VSFYRLTGGYHHGQEVVCCHRPPAPRLTDRPGRSIVSDLSPSDTFVGFEVAGEPENPLRHLIS
jgi:hypothetical protein